MPQKIKAKNFWSVKAEGNAGVGHLYLYGPISSATWWGDEVTPQMLLNDLKSMGELNTLNVHIFSGGGDLFAGMAIHSMLKQQTAVVNVYIEGLAASIASVIALAGANIYISRGALMMVHNAAVGLFDYYNSHQLSSIQADLAKFNEVIISAYMERCGKTRDEVVAMMDGDDNEGTWYSADEAISARLADAYIPEEQDTALDAVASLSPNVYTWNGYTFDLNQYENAPKLKTVNKRRNKPMAKPSNSVKTKPARNDAGSTGAVNQTVEITCPECGAVFSMDLPAGETSDVTCPECGAEFQWEVPAEQQQEESSSTPGQGTEAKNQFKAGVAAERKRISALDGIATAMPAAASIVNEAKKEGWSFTKTSQKVFESLANGKQSQAANNAAFLSNLAADAQNSGASTVGSAPGANGVNGATDEAAKEALAVNMILAGTTTKKAEVK